MNVISPHKLVMLFTGRIQSNVNQEQIKQISLRAKRSIIITNHAVDVSFIDVSLDVYIALHYAQLIAQRASCFQYKLNCERAHIGVSIASTTRLL